MVTKLRENVSNLNLEELSNLDYGKSIKSIGKIYDYRTEKQKLNDSDRLGGEDKSSGIFFAVMAREQVLESKLCSKLRIG
jgi:hypothetical protein